MQYYSAVKKEQTIDLLSSKNESDIYMEFKDRQNSTIVVETLAVASYGIVGIHCKGLMEPFQGWKCFIL